MLHTRVLGWLVDKGTDVAKVGLFYGDSFFMVRLKKLISPILNFSDFPRKKQLKELLQEFAFNCIHTGIL